MTLLRLGFIAAAISLSSCSLSTAPEPPEFKLSAEARGKQYRAMRKTGAVSLYAGKIETSKDEWGRETHRASGGALLVKETTPPIMALAPSISITPEHSEVIGMSTVRKDDRLYIGQDESARIRIDGGAIVPEGAVAVRGIADEAAAAEAEAQKEAKAQAKAKAHEEAELKAAAKAQADAEAKAQKIAEATAKAEAKAQAKADKAKADAEARAQETAAAEAKAQEKAEAKARAEQAKAEAAAKSDADANAEKARAEARARTVAEAAANSKKAPAPEKKKVVNTSKPKAKPVASTKPKAETSAKPKVTPVVDRSRVLNLMREPTER